MKLDLLFTLVVIAFSGYDCHILGTYVMPHGGIALAPRYFNTTNQTAKEEAWKLHDACSYVGKYIDEELNPDLIFLSTPHGISDLEKFVFYLNTNGYGTGDTDNCQCPPCCFTVNVKLDNSTSLNLVNSMKSSSNVSGMTGYGPPGQSEEPFPLRWGEVIPLHFLPNINRTRVLILSHPSRRYTEDVSMIPELLKLGEDLYKHLESLKEKVVVIISGDLAHTHLKSGPYGYSDAAEPLDEIGLMF